MAMHESDPSSLRVGHNNLSMQVLKPVNIRPPPFRMALPAELLEEIIDYLPVKTQLVFARTSRAIRDMVYDDTRWVAKLKAMGVWNEEEARRTVEKELQLQQEAIQRAKQEAVLGRRVTASNKTNTVTIFDAAQEIASPKPFIKVTDDLLDLGGDGGDVFGDFQSVSISPEATATDFCAPLNILSSVISRRGQARSEFGKVYAGLAPIYTKLCHADSLEDVSTFRQLQRLEDQATLLKILELFGRARAVDNWTKCQKRLAWHAEMFESRMLTEFEESILHTIELILGHMTLMI